MHYTAFLKILSRFTSKRQNRTSKNILSIINPMEKIYSLISCRVSSEKQVKEGHGLESQEQRCRKYSNEKGYTFEETFLDEGVSGAVFDRPAIRQILSHIDKNPHKKYVVIFDDINRIARDVQVHWAIKKEFELRGAKVESPNFKFEDTPEGTFIETILAGKSQLDRQQNARQVVQKMKARFECGYFCLSACPCGMEYKQTAEHGKLIHIKEPEASIIKDALEGFASGRFIMQSDVLNFLLKNRDAFKNNKRIDLNFVKRILTSIVYAGYVEYAPWEVARRKGHHEALISIETYEKIQEKLQKSEKKVTTRDNEEFPLRRLVYCSVCGKKMTGAYHTSKKKVRTPHYTCNNTDCKANPKNIKRAELEKDYKELLHRIAPESEIIDLTKAIALDVWQKSMDDIKSSESEILRENKKRDEQIENYITLASKASNDFAREKYETMAEALEKENKASKKQALPSNNLNTDDAISEVLDFLGTPDKYWEKTNLKGKFMVHDLIFTSNLMYDAQNRFGTPEISLPFTIKDAFSTASSRRVDRTGLEPATSSVQMRRSTR